MTDYTGVPLEDVVEHLREWRARLPQTVEVLGNVRVRLLGEQDNWRARDGVAFIDKFIDLFTRYIGDLERLLAELPSGVQQRHFELVRQLYESAKGEEAACVAFQREHHLDALGSAVDVRHTLAQVYAITRDAVIDLKDLSNLVPRLRTYVAMPAHQVEGQASAANALELKPNFMGLGINFNYIIDRCFRRGDK